jgi:rhamnosyltransferase
MRTAILIPTYNAGAQWELLLESVATQDIAIDKKIIIDSGSTDNTVEVAKKYGYEILFIEKEKFDHGYARQLLAEAAFDIDALIYLTQDCILADAGSVRNLLTFFSDEKVGIAYGRQLPRVEAKLLEAHARNFNYPPTSKIKTFADREVMGIKTASCSNSFAAYRKEAFNEIGGFPSNSIFGEDVIVGGKMLLKGWKIAYAANAEGYHSHNYTLKQEFKRYFDIGVFHRTNDWLLEEFGSASGEGLKYVKSELNIIFKKNMWLFPKMITSTIAKWLGYKLGLSFKKLPYSLNRKFSMHKSYWDKQLNTF